MTPAQPYLIRALYEWILDNELTPHLLVEPRDDVQVPPRAIRDGKVVLNISPQAVSDLKLDNEVISFEARFGGDPFPVFVPVDAVRGVYARENGRGMLFPEETEGSPPDGSSDDGPDAPVRGRLRVVK